MENYAKKLALDHKILEKSEAKTFPVKKMAENFAYIGKTYDILNESVSKDVPIPPSGEWILDNYYIIEEQVSAIQKELLLSKYKKLPSVNGVSRIYIVAKEMVRFTDAYISEETIERFVSAYQTKKSISMEELWLLPVMLKIAIIEYIKELCERITVSQLQKFKVESLVERLVKVSPISKQKFHKYKSVMLNNEATSYVEYLIYCLKKLGKDGLKYIEILEEEIRKVGTTSNEIIKVEHYDLAVRRVSMSNSITSMRNISRFNFIDIFEKINPIESILSGDELYYKLDFETRNSYREEIRKLAKLSNTSEVYVASNLLELTDENEHIGIFLLGEKKEQLLRRLGIKKQRKDHALCMKTFEYILAIYLPTILFSVLIARRYFYLALIPMSEVFVYMINKIINKNVRPKRLPRLEKIPEDVNTFVVVPTLLNNKNRVAELIQSLERYYLGNKMDNLYFALLGDASEVDTEKMPYDEEVIETGLKEVEKLNKKYGQEIFFFLYRKRIYNDKQGKWLGYERKRGMLAEFNKFLLTGEKGTFKTNTITQKLLDKKIKYVITLDADTELGLDSAKKLVGIMEHPLNKPIIKDGIVVSGYGLIQPKVGISIESSTKSIFAKIFAGNGGIDMYSTAESNVYQDVFGEAIFTGKGIYNVSVFQKILENEIPENTVLSHDLLEGSYIRCGLASDVEVIDGFPERVNSYMVRQKRWTRGDWQIIRWLWKGPLNCLSKYKIFDNLRRSLISIFTLALFFAGFYLLPLFLIFFPFFLDTIDILFRKIINTDSPGKDDIRIKNKNYLPIISGIKGSLYRCTLQLVFLPYNAALMLEAIVVTLYRMIFSKKYLLEWLTAADAEKVLGKDLKSFVKEMTISPLIGFILLETTLIYNSITTPAAFALFLIWFATPYISYFIGLPKKYEKIKLNGEDKKLLIEMAKNTWDYFEDYMNEENNFMPPDNLQDKRSNLIVNRTSSTNIGLRFVSNNFCQRSGIHKRKRNDRKAF